MHVVCEFKGIRIEMEYKARSIPYILVSVGQKKALFSIESCQIIEVIGGTYDDFPYIERSLVTGWMRIHHKELMQNWKSLESNPNSRPMRIKPLK